jgi:hypothetical protein
MSVFVWSYLLTLWLNRNDCVFNNLVISSPCIVIFRLISSFTALGGGGAGGGQGCTGRAG